MTRPQFTSMHVKPVLTVALTDGREKWPVATTAWRKEKWPVTESHLERDTWPITESDTRHSESLVFLEKWPVTKAEKWPVALAEKWPVASSN